MNTPLVLVADGVPAAPSAGTAPVRPTLSQCLLLALLLHLWLVTLVGTATGPEQPPGDGAWSTLRIRLEGPGPADSTGRATQVLPDTGPVGRAPEPRYGGAVRDAVPRPTPEPGAAQLGAWSPQPTPSPLRPRAAVAPAAPEPAAQALSPPQLRRDRGPPAPAAAAPAVQPAQPTAADPVPEPSSEPSAGPSVAPRLAPQGTVEAPVIDRPDQSQRDISHSARTPAPVPQAQSAPAPQRPPVAPALPLPPPRAVVPPPPLTDVAAPLPIDAGPVPDPVVRVAPPPPVVAVPPVPPAPAVAPEPEPPPAPPAALPSPPPPLAADPAPPAALPEPPRAPLAAPPERLPTTLQPIEPPPLPQAPPPPLRLPAVQPPEAARALPAAPAPPPVAPGVTTSPGGAGPQAAARQGADRATPPSASASAPLRLDLPAARGALPGLVNPRVLNLVPPPPLRKSPLAEGIEKSGKTDCRTAYAGMGVLGVVPLAADALRSGGCRW